MGGHELAGLIEELGEGVNPADYPIGAKGRRARAPVLRNLLLLPPRSGKSLHPGVCQILGGGRHAHAGRSGRVYRRLISIRCIFCPPTPPMSRAVFVEPFACVLNSIERGHIELGDDVVVIGGGVMGILHVIERQKMSGRARHPQRARCKAGRDGQKIRRGYSF